MALPLALAFGLQSGMSAISGLYGGTSTQISGSTGPMIIFSAVVISNAIGSHGGSLETAMGTIISIFFLLGCFKYY